MLSTIACAVLPAVPVAAQDARPWLAEARAAGNWLASVAVETEHGLAWRAHPAGGGATSTSLYSGAPGVVLFFYELERVDPDGERARSRSAGPMISSLVCPRCSRPERALNE